MAVYIVIAKPPTQDIPALGDSSQVTIYRGDHASEQAAIDAASAVLRPGPGGKLWTTLQSNFNRYIAAESHTYSAAAG